MIRVERVDNGWEIQVRDDDLRKEFGLVAAACMRRIPIEEMLELVRKAADHVDEVVEMDNKQSKLFQRRFWHLMEINGYILEDMARAWNFPQEDVEDIKNGAIPSKETLLKMTVIFHVDIKYFFGVENETD